ncbi:MAG: 30S ribosomal protein S17 [Candidatus Woesebacteria bacterium GW2011_GWA1_41_13b]|uniref:Small ribosomal subunit protein uS17 n=1 Tax=Candidatus Woesebacteria bacterium GW2011_GWA1_41_13b TaxID=1618555 RepID=A0A0G0UWV4_9BACT|nr:MAG: 30S ribosomal protein S17 [Candidatus Woesebacteria bacterium GW2011_GWA1_41_13b]
MKAVLGKIISNKMKQTVVVEVARFMAHPLYHKRVKRTTKFHAHDETGAKPGDNVKMMPISPMSKTKTWKVIEIVKK